MFYTNHCFFNKKNLLLVMYKLLITLITLVFITFGNFKVAFAIEDGIYTGVFKMIYGHGLSTSKKGDTGIFKFHNKTLLHLDASHTVFI